jgi:transposase-like protein
VLESFVTKERDKAAALKFMKKLMKRHGTAEKITTDGLRSYRLSVISSVNAGLKIPRTAEVKFPSFAAQPTEWA